MKKLLATLLLLSTISYGQTYYSIGAGSAFSTNQKENSAMIVSTGLRYQPHRLGLMASFSILTGIDHTFDNYALEATYGLNKGYNHTTFIHSGYILDHNRRRQQTRQGGVIGLTNLFRLDEGVYGIVDVSTLVYGNNFIPSFSIGIVLRVRLLEKGTRRFF